jgi:hypothetical protein
VTLLYITYERARLKGERKAAKEYLHRQRDPIITPPELVTRSIFLIIFVSSYIISLIQLINSLGLSTSPSSE